MTAREQLELAAKAAGLPYEWRTEYIDVETLLGEKQLVESSKEIYIYGKPWNPLNDDGDALRLAVKLNIGVWFDIEPDGPVAMAQAESESFGFEVEDIGRDPCAATRRVIVRAAAEIGRGME